MEKPDESLEDAKRVKQLTNQNLKLKRLLQTALDISRQDFLSNDRLKGEHTDLTKTVECLEEEKLRLEKELSEILEKNEIGLVRALRKLEEEHSELQAEMHGRLNGLIVKQNETAKLETEDLELRSALIKLEQEKCRLLEKLQKVEEEKKRKNGSIFQHKLSELNGVKDSASTTNSGETEPTNKTSDDNILSTFIQLEKTYKEYIDILEEHTLENKISDLISKNEELGIKTDNSEPDDRGSQKKLNETILHSNTNILNKIKDVKSKLATSVQKNNNIKSDESRILSLRISEMEREKELIYQELEDYLQSSSKDISKVSENVNDPEIKLLVHEIEVQKAVLLYNLRMLKLKAETTATSSKSAFDTIETIAPPSSPASLLPRDSGEIKQLFTNDKEACGKSSSLEASAIEGHRRLEETVTRLENERQQLLKQLQSVSGTTTLRYEERQLQTQSELHSTFMREESSQEIVTNKNFDDATNQLYTADELRLEQRIRELESENNRIKREVQRLTESAQYHYLPAQVLRERIEELEKKTQSQPQIE